MRNDVVKHPITASIAYKTRQDGSPVPRLRQMSVELSKGEQYGNYTLFSVDTIVPGGLSSEATVDISGGKYTDGFHRVKELGRKCQPFKGPKKKPSGSAKDIFTSIFGGPSATSASASGVMAMASDRAPFSSATLERKPGSTVPSPRRSEPARIPGIPTSPSDLPSPPATTYALLTSRSPLEIATPAKPTATP